MTTFRSMTVDLDEVRKSNETRARSILHFINTVCLPEGTATMEQIEELSREVDEAIVRMKHDIARMENKQA